MATEGVVMTSLICSEQQKPWSLQEAVLAAGATETADIHGFLLLTDEITGHILNARYSDYPPSERENLKKV